MTQDEKDMLLSQIAMSRSVYSLIDKKIPLLVDAETRFEDAVEAQRKNNSKFKGKYFIIGCIALSFALLIPLCILSMVFSMQLYWFTPVFAVVGLYIYKLNYNKKTLPVINKANQSTIEAAKHERNDLINIINQSYFNIKTIIYELLRSTDNDEFIAQLDSEGIPFECENLIALDYIYSAIKKNCTDSFADALLHFQELKKSLKEKNDDKNSQELYKDIIDGELQAEYRRGYIYHCQKMIPEISFGDNKEE